MGKEISRVRIFIIFLCLGLYVINQNGFLWHSTSANATNQMNIYIDEKIAFKYPRNFLLKKREEEGIYDLVQGDYLINIHICDKGRWQRHQRTYLFSFQMKEIVPAEGPVNLRDNVWLEKYNANGFNGITLKFYNNNQRVEDDLFKIELFVFRENHYVFASASDMHGLSLNIFDDVLSSIVFPGEPSFELIYKQGSQIETIETLNSVKLDDFLKFGSPSKEKNPWFNVTYDSTEITDDQKQAVRSLVNNEKKIFEQSLTAIFRYYDEYMYPFYVEEVLIENLELIPKVDSKDEILPLVEFTEVYVHKTEEGGIVPLGLRFHCNWSDDGVGIRLVGDKIIAIGNDYVALGDEDGWEGFSAPPLSP